MAFTLAIFTLDCAALGKSIAAQRALISVFDCGRLLHHILLRRRRRLVEALAFAIAVITFANFDAFEFLIAANLARLPRVTRLTFAVLLAWLTCTRAVSTAVPTVLAVLWACLNLTEFTLETSLGVALARALPVHTTGSFILASISTFSD